VLETDCAATANLSVLTMKRITTSNYLQITEYLGEAKVKLFIHPNRRMSLVLHAFWALFDTSSTSNMASLIITSPFAQQPAAHCSCNDSLPCILLLPDLLSFKRLFLYISAAAILPFARGHIFTDDKTRFLTSSCR
jgi:hypothetical protein